MTASTLGAPARPRLEKTASMFRMLLRDPFATVSAAFLLVLVTAAVIGPFFLTEAATDMNLRMRNLAPFSLDDGFAYILGADSLGRSMLARLIVGARSSLAISAGAVLFSMTLGGLIGILAGYVGGWTSTVIMRLTDVIISFPNLLLALIVLYIIGPSLVNVVIILAVGALPIYIRTARAETLEIRERMFVSAARTLGVGTFAIVVRHILPLVAPTLTTVAAINFAGVILAESGLSFLGLGIQPPDFTWGAMVAAGRQYLETAWWLSFFPGLMIMATTLSLNLLANWLRTVTDPQQRWRLSIRKATRR
jgi:peptide/nickel transport system permease protein